MALPKLNANPKYDMIIPSTGKSVRFRPFLVKEEKVLMLAAESEDPKQMVSALADMVEACVQDKIDRSELTSTDVEYAFLKIRAKSVGETTKISLKCSECKEGNEVEVNVDKIVPPKSKKLTDRIELEKNLFVELKQPKFESIMDSVLEEGASDVDQILALVAECISAIVTENEHIKASDVSKQEIRDFLDSMNSGQFEKIKDFVEQLPRLTHEIEFKCNKCNHENKTIVEGIQSFLS